MLCSLMHADNVLAFRVGYIVNCSVTLSEYIALSFGYFIVIQYTSTRVLSVMPFSD